MDQQTYQLRLENLQLTSVLGGSHSFARRIRANTLKAAKYSTQATAETQK